MWTNFRNWLHHLLDPHCGACAVLTDEMLRCKSCETLREQLDLSNREKMKFLDAIMELTHKEEIQIGVGPGKDFQPINKRIPWHRERQRLEEESRQEAERLRRQKEIENTMHDVEKLEDLVLDDEGA
jgi:hypothetical protein